MSNYDMDDAERQKELSHMRKTLRMINLSGDSIRELEALAYSDGSSLLTLVRSTLEDRLIETPKYEQGEYYASR